MDIHGHAIQLLNIHKPSRDMNCEICSHLMGSEQSRVTPREPLVYIISQKSSRVARGRERYTGEDEKYSQQTFRALVRRNP